MDSRKPLTAAEIEELKEEIRTVLYKEFFGENLQPLIDDHSRLSALLTPPPDAAVREAVEFWADAETCPPIRSRWAEFRHHALVLLRAVQTPRPSSEQHRVVRIAVINADLRGDTEESEALRAAFPEAFDGEVGRG